MRARKKEKQANEENRNWGGSSCVLACFILEEAPERSLRVGGLGTLGWCCRHW